MANIIFGTNGAIQLNTTNSKIIFSIEQTVAPTISLVTVNGGTISWRVTNNDSEIVDISGTYFDGTPYYRNSVITFYDFTKFEAIIGYPFNITAEAKADGKTISTTTTYIVNE